MPLRSVRLFGAALALTCLPHDLFAQMTVHGRVLSVVADAPVERATITSLGTTRSTQSDAEGAFAIETRGRGDTLRVTAIGFAPNLVVILSDTVPLVIRMVRTTATVEDLRVIADRGREARLGQSGRSVLSDSTARMLPLALEPDALRVLHAAPGVAFNSIFSARPLLQGADADDTGFAVDGFEVLHPFHVGQIFAAFPAIATQEIAVELMPAPVRVGHSTAGRVDVRGREWNAASQSEIQYGIGAWSGITGLSGDAGSFTLAGRMLRGTLAGAAVDVTDIEGTLLDVYARGHLSSARTTVTLFRANERGAEQYEPGRPDPDFIEGGNSLLGVSTVLAERPQQRLLVTAARSTHHLRASGVSARRTSTSVHNHVSRAGGGLQYTATNREGTIGFEGSAGAYRRGIVNRVLPRDVGRIPSVDADRSLFGIEAAAAFTIETRGATVTPGVRVDALNGAVAVQPRLRVRFPMRDDRWFEVAAGRASRLMHLVSDATTDPPYTFHNYWIVAGDSGRPVARTDHLTMEYGGRLAGAAFRLRGFASIGDGSIDLDLEGRPSASPVGFRIGRTRTLGGEAALLWRATDSRWELHTAYTFMRSERDWGDGWLPAQGDRRHRVRVTGMRGIGGMFTLAGTLEAGTSVPFTPIVSFDPQRVQGQEHSGRGDPGLRIDAALTHEFGGPWGSRMTLGASISNLSLGDQVLRESTREITPDGNDLTGSIVSKPVFWIPPFPSIIVRVKW